MRIARIVDHVHRAAGGAENNQQRVGAGAEHGIEQHPRAVLPDGGQIHDGQNVINKGVEGVLLPKDQPGSLRVLKGHIPDILRADGGNQLLQPRTGSGGRSR